MHLKDKICLVAGAGSQRSIGFATAALFAEHGATVVALDIAMDDATIAALDETVAKNAPGSRSIRGVLCDIRDAVQCRNIVSDLVSRHGRIDCLVNSAGIVRGTPMLQIEDEEYDRILDVNLKGAFNLCQAVLPTLIAQRQGVIINLSSSAAQRGGGLVGGAHYAASKGGVIGLTRTIAREFGPSGIRANIVCPAMIDTAMLDGLSPERIAGIIDAIPLQRAGLPREVAGACLFLASDLAGFITGATIDVNGGSHIH